ncbi:AMP-binding protein [Mesobacterium pallidum]|uniref:AMP-binding protein n=1 Tax=Mesobacterium pallidum TaxID=2872037 RepID=UPI001EE31E54|nr:AMP-binding protein [Mesobacterium pallidum]
MEPLFGQSLMRPLLLSIINEHGAVANSGCKVIWRDLDGTVKRATFAEVNARSKQLANALTARGLTLGSRGTTIAWNTQRHLELFHGLTGIGAAIHTTNPRLAADQMNFVINDGGGEILFFDADMLPRVEEIAADLTRIREFVVLADRADMPESATLDLTCYEDMIAGEAPAFDWPEFDERTAATICYTSGTTGLPKGVVYAHRDCFLQTMTLCSVAWLPVPAANPLVMMPLAPMFHSSAWNYPFGAFYAGANLVLSGRDMTSDSVLHLMRAEDVTNLATASSVMMGLLQHVDATGGDFGKLESLITASTGMPAHIIERLETEFGIETAHNWGMTEIMFGSTGKLSGSEAALPLAGKLKYKTTDGRQTPGMTFRLVDDDGQPVPHDGKSQGHLRVKALWSTKSYLNKPDGSATDADGWLITGDIATIDPKGYMKIVDRAKDLIKSGGEWIASIDLENAALSHPGVAQVAAIAVDHDKFQERPLLVVVPKPGATVTEREILDIMRPKMAKWWLPEAVVFVDRVEVNANGKIRKNLLRDTYRQYLTQGVC